MVLAFAGMVPIYWPARRKNPQPEAFSYERDGRREALANAFGKKLNGGDSTSRTRGTFKTERLVGGDLVLRAGGQFACWRAVLLNFTWMEARDASAPRSLQYDYIAILA